MESKKIMEAMENGIVKAVHAGEVFKIPYESRIDVAAEMQQAHKKIDHAKVQAKITSLLEEELARKIVNKIITEMGTDIKKLMENATIRDDFRFLLRKGVEAILEKVKADE